jgi:hypothetical protein
MSGLEFLSCCGASHRSGQAVSHRPQRSKKGRGSIRTCASVQNRSKTFSFWLSYWKNPMKGRGHFDAHAYRSEDEAGVWEFAAGCMRKLLDPEREGVPVSMKTRRFSRCWSRYGRHAGSERIAWELHTRACG